MLGPDLFLWFLALLTTAGTLALARAESLRPAPPAHEAPKPLNHMVATTAAVISSASLVLIGLHRYGLVLPGCAVALLALVWARIGDRDLTPYYRFNLLLGLAALVLTTLVLLDVTTGRTPL